MGGMKLKRLRNLPGKKHAPNSAREPVHPPAAAWLATREESGALPARCRCPGDVDPAGRAPCRRMRRDPVEVLQGCRLHLPCSGLSEGTMQREEQPLGKLGSGDVTCSDCSAYRAGTAACDPASHLHQPALPALNAFCCNARDRCLKTRQAGPPAGSLMGGGGSLPPS